jgi:hypothetical protein
MAAFAILRRSEGEGSGWRLRQSWYARDIDRRLDAAHSAAKQQLQLRHLHTEDFGSMQRIVCVAVLFLWCGNKQWRQ